MAGEDCRAGVLRHPDGMMRLKPPVKENAYDGL